MTGGVCTQITFGVTSQAQGYQEGGTETRWWTQLHGQSSLPFIICDAYAAHVWREWGFHPAIHSHHLWMPVLKQQNVLDMLIWRLPFLGATEKSDTCLGIWTNEIQLPRTLYFSSTVLLKVWMAHFWYCFSDYFPTSADLYNSLKMWVKYFDICCSFFFFISVAYLDCAFEGPCPLLPMVYT